MIVEKELVKIDDYVVKQYKSQKNQFRIKSELVFLFYIVVPVAQSAEASGLNPVQV